MILFLSTIIVPFSMTSSPFIVIMRAPVMAIILSGISDLSFRPISIPKVSVFAVLSSAVSKKEKAVLISFVKYRGPKVQFSFCESLLQ